MRRQNDWSRLLILGFGLFLILGGGSTALGQAQPCQGCLPPSSGIPTNPAPTYNPRIPSYPGSSSSTGPQTNSSGWTVPVPNQVTISNSGQVYFHYDNHFSGSPGGVPVSGINPYEPSTARTVCLIGRQ